MPTINFLFSDKTSEPPSLELAVAGNRNMLQTKNKHTNDIRIASDLAAPDIVNLLLFRTFLKNNTGLEFFYACHPETAKGQDSALVSLPELTNKNILLVIDMR